MQRQLTVLSAASCAAFLRAGNDWKRRWTIARRITPSIALRPWSFACCNLRTQGRRHSCRRARPSRKGTVRECPLRGVSETAAVADATRRRYLDRSPAPLDQRGVGFGHAGAAGLHHPRKTGRRRQHLGRIEGGGAQLGRVELTLRAAEPLRGD